MAVWLKTFKVKDLLDETVLDDPDEEGVRVAKILAERLLKEQPVRGYLALARKFDRVHGEGGFNRVLDELYDAADTEHVWIE